MKRIKVINISSYAIQYATRQSACVDLHSNMSYIKLMPGIRMLIKTGIRLEMPKNIEAQIRPRSGIALNHGITVLNTPGTIDPDYRGEIGVILINHGQLPYEIKKGDRVAQMSFKRIYRPRFQFVAKLSESLRGIGGFGSTGI